MRPPNTLSELIEEFESSLASNSYADATVRAYRRAPRALLAQVGNVQIRSLTSRHIDQFFALRQAQRCAPATLNAELSALRGMFHYAARRRALPAGVDPTAHRRLYRIVRRERLRIPASQFPRLLDSAAHPQDRIVIALGLYLFLRRSEIKLLRVGDVDLDASRVSVVIPKTSDFDLMPICLELDRELRNWLTVYAETIDRPLRPDDYLVASRYVIPFWPGMSKQDNRSLVAMSVCLTPTKPIGTPEHCVHRTLTNFGLPLRDASGESFREGVHTLRRSGARALFDKLVSDGYDYAIRTVQAMLHHTSMRTTEIYLGLELDKKKRDDIIRGKEMFPIDMGNVIEMEPLRAASAGIHNL